MSFISRHIGPNVDEQQIMLDSLGYKDLDGFINAVIPNDLLSQTGTTGATTIPEHKALQSISKIASKNKLFKNYIGMGYYETITPSVIKRNVLENPGWYTAYTPYQAEISQGRLEALLNYQQMVMDLTGFDLANASLLDEATAAAESMLMSQRINAGISNKFFVADNVLPQTLDVIKTRAKYADIEVVVGDFTSFNAVDYYGALVQNTGFNGELKDYTDIITRAKSANPKLVVTMACDILSLVLFKSPKTQGADIAVGSTQRFGIPLGFGGPHAAYMATTDAHKRTMPGRIIGLSVDTRGKKSLRMSLQTREQHIRREKATSNICTAQVLLANMAGFYAAYHGSNGLRAIANKIHHLTLILANHLKAAGFNLGSHELVFDTIVVYTDKADAIYARLIESGYLVGRYGDKLMLSLGEPSEVEDIEQIITCFSGKSVTLNAANEIVPLLAKYKDLYRTDRVLTHPVFNTHHSETQMMRYLKYLENKDISLVHSMIPLGSCTMKLNAASELEPVSWAGFANIHPFAPKQYVEGYMELARDLESQLKAITGFDAVSLQPNSGAQGEYAGILTIRRYQESIGEGGRNICLIPKSAHGTNPATAQMMGLTVVVVECDSDGNINVDDLTSKAILHKDNLSCLMVTYPSTHGVFETAIKKICQIIHDNGGQVYMDGANLNAQVGLMKPAELGADVMHSNLHKTFCIPHGGGGPGMGPIGCKAHLAPFLPDHHHVHEEIKDVYAVNAAPYGSASILPITWMYITMMGEYGLSLATKIAILNANYIASRLSHAYPVLYTGNNGLVAHECIIDLRPLKLETGITEVDIAKRLMDYGFHSPTMSFPVPGTLMIEPTESESLVELDKFISAMLSIHAEVLQVKQGGFDKMNNPLKNAPHTLADIIHWDKPYSVEIGCFPLEYLKQSKVFPTVNRIDDAHGDRNFICNCFDFNS
jgi:glycine dehydrogenase